MELVFVAVITVIGSVMVALIGRNRHNIKGL